MYPNATDVTCLSIIKIDVLKLRNVSNVLKTIFPLPARNQGRQRRRVPIAVDRKPRVIRDVGSTQKSDKKQTRSDQLQEDMINLPQENQNL